LDIHEIPPDVTRITPVLFPEPVNFVTDFSMTRDSFGGGSVAKMTVLYTLHYTFCYTQIGAARTGLDAYIGAVEMAALILDAVLDIDTFSGGIDIQPIEVSEFGPVPDPAGNQYLGCRFAFQVQEYVN
jgi:hypothetical protein